MLEPATGEGATDEDGMGRLQDATVATAAVVAVGDSEEDVQPANDPAMTTADTNAAPGERTQVRRL